MAELFSIIPSGFSFTKTAGYNKVLPNTIGKYFEHARGDATDLYVVKHCTQSGAIEELARGYVPTGTVENASELRQKQIELSNKFDEEARKASEQINTPTKLYQSRDNEYAYVFAPCKDGIIGCGWYDHAATAKKGLKMAAFVLYAYGVLNVDVDPKFWEVTYKYLPYDSELGRSEVADEIIFNSMQEEIISRNTTRTHIVRISNGNKKVPDE